jgi:transposase
VTNDDVLYRSRLRLFALAKEMGSVRAACRMLGVHHSTSSRWQRQLVRFGTEILRPRERRRPRMPNAISPMVEQGVLALALANPGWGPHRLSLELGRPKWGGLRVSGNGVWRVLKRHGLNTRAWVGSPVTPRRRSRSHGRPLRCSTSRPTALVIEFRWTASPSAA